MRVCVFCFICRFTKGMQDCKVFSCVSLNVKCLEVTDAGNYSCRLLETDGTETFPESPFKLDVFGRVHKSLYTRATIFWSNVCYLKSYSFLFALFLDPIKVANSTGSLRQKVAGGNNNVTLWCRFKGQNIHSVTWHRKNDQENLPK